jgi:hypothetical protein
VKNQEGKMRNNILVQSRIKLFALLAGLGGILIWITLVTSASAQANIIKLSNLQALGNNIYQQQISPDSNWVVYRADHDTEDIQELYSVPIDGSTDPIKLNAPMTSGGNTYYDYKISPDSSLVVYRADQDTDGILELYSVPIDGSVPPTKLNQNLITDEYTGYFHISADSNRVVYETDNDQTNITKLYSVPIDGSAVPTELNGIQLSGSYIWGHQISADSTRVIFFAIQDYNGDHTSELYSVLIDGSAAPIKLNSTLVNGGDVKSFQISANSNRVIYLAEQDIDGVNELYSVPINGNSASTKLNSPLVYGRNVESFKINSDSSMVVYKADQDTYDVDELYSVPINGGVSPTKLNGTLVSGGDVWSNYQISSDGDLVVYSADQDTYDVNELYSVAIDGSTSPTKLNSTLVSGGDVRTFQIDGINSRVIYLADQDTDGVLELYSVPIDRSTSPIKLNGALVSGGSVRDSFQISADNSRVVYYAEQDKSGIDELYSVPIDGSSTPTKLNGALVEYSVQDDFQVSADSNQVVYRANQSTSYAMELYSVSIDGNTPSKQLDDPQALVGNVQYETEKSQISADSNWTVYLADQDVYNVIELYSVPIDGSSLPTKLNDTLIGGGDVESFKISPDSNWVIYQADQDTDKIYELYSVPLDGNTTPIKLNGALVSGGVIGTYQISANSNRVIYRADQDTDGVFEIYTVPIDGSAAPIKLNTTLASGRNVGNDFKISPDSNWVIYRADQDTEGMFELYSVPIDGNTTPIKINDELISGGDVAGDFQVSTNSNWVVYRADQDTNDVIELYSVPIDGSTLPTKLNGTLVNGGYVRGGFQISPDSSMVVYSADQDTQYMRELYSVPVDGGTTPLKLNDPMVSGGSLGIHYSISPNGNVVVYQADQDTDDVMELYSVSIDRTSAPIKLNSPLVSGGDVYFFKISPDSGRVVYTASQDILDVEELYSVPIDGSVTPIKLNSSLVYGRLIVSFEISTDSSLVVYHANQEDANTLELYSIPIDGSPVPTKLNGIMTTGGDVWGSYDLSSDSNWVIYVANQDNARMKELYASDLNATFFAKHSIFLPSIIAND